MKELKREREREGTVANKMMLETFICPPIEDKHLHYSFDNLRFFKIHFPPLTTLNPKAIPK